MVSSSMQTKLGKAFEYACIQALFERYQSSQKVFIEETPQMNTARCAFESVCDKQLDLMNAAHSAVRVISKLEPRLKYKDGDEPLVLALQSDASGIAGDVRDVLCIRRGHEWEIGFSCKHNHHAVKHSRLSDQIDFGADWFGYRCSNLYFEEVVPKFTELRILRDTTKKTGSPALWSDLDDKAGDYYEPILQSFIDELMRLNQKYPDVPERLIRYLIGRHDFYKIITDDSRRTTRVEAVNINGTLNESSEGHKSITTVPLLKLPTKFYHIGFKEDKGVRSQNTIHVVCDNGWEISLRLHNASSRIEPSLKFDVQLISLPSTLFAQVEPWDIEEYYEEFIMRI